MWPSDQKWSLGNQPFDEFTPPLVRFVFSSPEQSANLVLHPIKTQIKNNDFEPESMEDATGSDPELSVHEWYPAASLFPYRYQREFFWTPAYSFHRPYSIGLFPWQYSVVSLLRNSHSRIVINHPEKKTQYQITTIYGLKTGTRQSQASLPTSFSLLSVGSEVLPPDHEDFPRLGSLKSMNSRISPRASDFGNCHTARRVDCPSPQSNPEWTAACGTFDDRRKMSVLKHDETNAPSSLSVAKKATTKTESVRRNVRKPVHVRWRHNFFICSKSPSTLLLRSSEVPRIDRANIIKPFPDRSCQAFLAWWVDDVQTR